MTSDSKAVIGPRDSMEEDSKINFISTFLFSVLPWAKHCSKGDAVVSQNKQGPCPHGIYILVGETQTLWIEIKAMQIIKQDCGIE